MVSNVWLEGFDPSYVFKTKLDFKNWLLENMDEACLQPFISTYDLGVLVDKMSSYGLKTLLLPVSTGQRALEIINKKSAKISLSSIVSFPFGNESTAAHNLQEIGELQKLGINDIGLEADLNAISKDEYSGVLKDLVESVHKAGGSLSLSIDLKSLPKDRWERALEIVKMVKPDFVSTQVPYIDNRDGTSSDIDDGTVNDIVKFIGSKIEDKQTTGIKVAGDIFEINDVVSALFYGYNSKWPLDRIKIITSNAFEILEQLNTSDF